VLSTDNRLLLSEVIAPPEDHELDVLVITTYSLQLTALLAVPLALTFADWEDADGGPTSDPIVALEAVRRYADRVTVFCQAGETAASGQAPIVASWLEDAVTPVKAPGDGVFHPKVWIARYRDAGRTVRYRLLCASRNLTFDRSWDTVVVLDGEPTPRSGRSAGSEPLADFVRALPSLAVSGMPRKRASVVRDLSEELRRVRFTVPDGFNDIRFRPLGISGYNDDPFAARRITRWLVVSPFLSARRLTSFTPERTDNVLISRAEEISMISSRHLTGFDRVCALDDVTATDDTDSGDAGLRGLHAKVYIAEAGYDATVWIGSANATTAGFGRNVEFLLELSGRRSQCGIDAVLGSPEDPTALAALLIDVGSQDPPADRDPADLLEAELDQLARYIAERRFTASISGGSGRFAVDLVARPAPVIGVDTYVRCWPLTEPRERHSQPIRPGPKLFARFDELELESITAFFAIEVELSRDGISATKGFAIRAELIGLPSGRREAITRSLLRDPDQVMRLLRMLLAFDPDAANHGAGEPMPGRGGAPWLIGESSLLEALLRALADSPRRIDVVASLIDDLKDAAPEVLPPGFLEIWEPIRAARTKTRGNR
jgi:hypothetical protein